MIKNFLSVACKKIHAQLVADHLAMLHEGLFSIKDFFILLELLEFHWNLRKLDNSKV